MLSPFSLLRTKSGWKGREGFRYIPFEKGRDTWQLPRVRDDRADVVFLDGTAIARCSPKPMISLMRAHQRSQSLSRNSIEESQPCWANRGLASRELPPCSKVIKGKPIRPAVRLVLAATLALAASIRVSAQPGLTGARVVGYGVRHLEFALPGPFALDVLEITLPNPSVHVETFRPNGLMTTSGQAAANDREGHRVIGAVNGDLFSTGGIPVGNQVANGTFVHGVVSTRSHFLTDDRHRPMIERISFVGSARAFSGGGFSVSGVNVDRVGEALVFYTSYSGAATSTTDGVEAAVEFPGTAVSGGDTLRVRVTSVASGGATAIPVNGGVLSAGAGAPATFLSSFGMGDTLSLYLGFDPPLRHIEQAIAGAGRILLAGRNVTDSMAHLEGLTTSFTDVRNPRTFVGFNGDTTKLYICTVDGRQTSSLGMTFDEMASFLFSLGVTDAFNLDGGGSSTMVVRGETVNSPSDPGGEREVANTIQLISTAPEGTLANLAIQPRRREAYQGEKVLFVAAGTNEYCDPTPLPSNLSWEVDGRLGEVTADGLFTAGDADDSGWVRVSWGAARDSARVVVHTLTAIAPRSPAYVMVMGDAFSMRVLGTTSTGTTVVLVDSQMTFTAGSPIISVDEGGLVRATGVGTAGLDIRYGGLSSQALFDCTGNDTTVNADSLGRLDDWSITRVNTDEQEAGIAIAPDPVSPRKVLLIDHSHLPGPKGVDFTTLLPLAGEPDSTALRVYGSGNADTIRIVVTDRNGARFSLVSDTVVNWLNAWSDVGFRISSAVSQGPIVLSYPVAISQMQVRFGMAGGPGGFVQGLLYLADIRVHYSHRASTGVAGRTYPGRVRLLQNFPNPFNPTTVVSYQLPAVSEVRLCVYDLLGREVRVLVNERKPAGDHTVRFDGSGLASGVYLYRLTAGSFVETREMVLLR
jgi:hypothetical protein